MKDDYWNKKVKERDSNVCRHCGFDKNIHVHHILPKEKHESLQHAILKVS